MRNRLRTRTMFLDLNQYTQNKYIPFLKNGIIIDTSVLIIFIDGLIETRIGKKLLGPTTEFRLLLSIFDRFKLTGQYAKFCITTHILTEFCSHIRNCYNDNENYDEIVLLARSILDPMCEKVIEKQKMLDRVGKTKPHLELGDISIFLVADDFVNSGKKVAVLAKDRIITTTFKDHQHVMMMDFNHLSYNLV